MKKVVPLGAEQKIEKRIVMQRNKEYMSYSQLSPVHGFAMEESEEQIEKIICVVDKSLVEIDIAVKDKGYQLYGIKKHEGSV